MKVATKLAMAQKKLRKKCIVQYNRKFMKHCLKHLTQNQKPKPVIRIVRSC